MKYIYDKEGKKIATHQQGTNEEINEQYENESKIYISDTDLGETAIIDKDTIRAKTEVEKVRDKERELQEGEYIEGNEIKYIEKPNNFHFWDIKKNEWAYSKELEISGLNGEILSLENELLTKYDEYDKAVARKLKTLEKKLNSDIEELSQKIDEKYKRLGELEG